MIGAVNDDAFPLPATLEFRCGFDPPLSAVSPLFTRTFLESTAPNIRVSWT